MTQSGHHRYPVILASFPGWLLALLDSLGFGYSNIRKHSVIQF
jgi:hypothetical protein